MAEPSIQIIIIVSTLCLDSLSYKTFMLSLSAIICILMLDSYHSTCIYHLIILIYIAVNGNQLKIFLRMEWQLIQAILTQRVTHFMACCIILCEQESIFICNLNCFRIFRKLQQVINKTKQSIIKNILIFICKWPPYHK